MALRRKQTFQRLGSFIHFPNGAAVSDEKSGRENFPNEKSIPMKTKDNTEYQ